MNEQPSKIYLLPNLMTAGNLFCGFTATLKILEGALLQSANADLAADRSRPLSSRERHAPCSLGRARRPGASAQPAPRGRARALGAGLKRTAHPEGTRASGSPGPTAACLTPCSIVPTSVTPARLFEKVAGHILCDRSPWIKPPSVIIY